jgi:putative ABC transport system substrate-binding protein
LSACSLVNPPSPKTARLLYFGTGNTATDDYAAFREGLQQAGWVDGQNLIIEWHSHDIPNVDNFLPALNTAVAQGGPVVVFVDSTPHALALKQAVSVVPIIVAIGDPVGSGVVSTFARPGGNITGVSSAPYDLIAKRIELFREVAPNTRKLGVLYSEYTMSSSPNLAAAIRESAAAGQPYGMQVEPLEARRPEDYEAALERFARSSGDAVAPIQDVLTLANQVEIAALARKYGLATLCARSDWVEHGCLMSYGANRPALYKRASTYIDRVLRGTPPGDLPIERPSVYDLSINVKTLRALGLTVPETTLPLVTEWIQ